jgi:hypothetical protein
MDSNEENAELPANGANDANEEARDSHARFSSLPPSPALDWRNDYSGRFDGKNGNGAGETGAIEGFAEDVRISPRNA